MMLLEADWILPVSGPPLRDGAVTVTDGKIAEVGPAAELRARRDGDERRSFPGCVLMPGLINAHSHLEYSAFHGVGRSCGFGEWMLRLLLARRKLNLDDYAVSARWGARECLRAGMTYLAETSFEGWTSARAAGEAGLRARVHLEVIGLDEADLPGIMGRMEAKLGALQEGCGPLVEPGLSPHAPYTVSQRLYWELARYARRNGVRLATHVAESRAEVEMLERGTGAIAAAYKAAQLWKGQRWSSPGVSPVSFLERADALGPEMLAVHCVQLERDDVNILAGSGAAVAHCPRSNTRLQCGAAPVTELRAAGVLTGLGTDSLASNDSLDLFAEMRAAIEASRARAAAALAGGAGAAPRVTAEPWAVAPAWGDSPEVLDEETVLRMATLEGAAALGLADRLGSLEPGKEADIVAVRLPDAAPAGALGAVFASPVVAPVAAVVNGASPAHVRMTMVAGAVVFEGSDRPPAPDDLDLAFAAVSRKLHPEG